MTNVKRFTIRCMEDEQHYGIEVENPEGSFVDIADYSLLLERLERMQKALKTVEWVSYNDPDYGQQTFCNVCRADRKYGHAEGCQVAEALEEKP